MFKQTVALTEEEKCKVSEMCGNIILWILKGESIGYMSEQLNLQPWQVKYNIDEMLYILRKQVGNRHFFKTLFIK